MPRPSVPRTTKSLTLALTLHPGLQPGSPTTTCKRSLVTLPTSRSTFESIATLRSGLPERHHKRKLAPIPISSSDALLANIGHQNQRYHLQQRRSVGTDLGSPVRQSSSCLRRRSANSGQWSFFFNHRHTPDLGQRHTSGQLQQHHSCRLFSAWACSPPRASASISLTQRTWNCCQKEQIGQQSLSGTQSWISMDGMHRGPKPGSSVGRHANCETAHHSSNLSRSPKSTSRTTAPSIRRVSSRTTSSLFCPAGIPRSCNRHIAIQGHFAETETKRFVHSSRNQRSRASGSRSSDHKHTLSSSFTAQDKHRLVSEFRQAILAKTPPRKIWEKYKVLSDADHLFALTADDVGSLFQLLKGERHIEESLEMMLQITFDLSDMNRQLPQKEFLTLLGLTIDYLPSEQTKRVAWQIQGRRGFIAKNLQGCETTAEMRRVFELYKSLLQAEIDPDVTSDFIRRRKLLKQSMARVIVPWVLDQCKEGRLSMNSGVMENILVFMLNRGLMDEVFPCIQAQEAARQVFSSGFYKTVIHRYGLAKRFDTMELLVSKLKRSGRPLSVHIYSAMIDAYSKAGNLRDAQVVYQDILLAGHTPEAATFGPMLHAVGKTGDHEVTNELIRQMELTGVDSNPYTLSAVLTSLSDDPEKSHTVLDEWTEKVQANVVNYNLLTRAYQRVGDVEGAFRVYRQMIGKGINPDKYSFSTLLSIFASRGDVQGAERLWDEMINVHHVTPNVYVYGSMLHMYCRANDLTSAQTVYREMLASGIRPNEVIFGSLLNAYARLSDLTQMLSIYDNLRSEGLKPNTFIYTNLLFGLVKDGDMVAARRLYDTTIEDGFGRNVIALTILMKGYLDKEQYSAAQAIYSQMIQMDLVPNFVTYALMMKAHVKQGNRHEARMLLNDLMDDQLAISALRERAPFEKKRQGGEGTSAGDNVSTTFADDGSEEDFDGNIFSDPTAIDVRSDLASNIGSEGNTLKAHATPQSLMVFAPLLDLIAKDNDLVSMNNLFLKMEQKNIRPNTVAFTILMDSYRRAGDLSNVMRIWQELYESYSRSLAALQKERLLGSMVQLDHDRGSVKPWKASIMLRQPLSIVMDTLGYKGNVKEVIRIWTKLERDGFDFDSSNVNDFCVALARNGRVLDACRIIEERLLDGYQSVTFDAWSATMQDDKGKLPGSSKKTSHNDKWESPSSRSSADTFSPTNNQSQLTTLFYPRPRTFAALADVLEDLLGSIDDRRTHFHQYKEEPAYSKTDRRTWSKDSPRVAAAIAEAEREEAKVMLKQRQFIEKRLQGYPKPFEALDKTHRKILWSMVQSQYPAVLSAMGEGMLSLTEWSVASKEVKDESQQRGENEGKIDKDYQESGNQQQTSLDNDNKVKDEPLFGRFRRWKRLHVVAKDLDRSRFLEAEQQKRRF